MSRLLRPLPLVVLIAVFALLGLLGYGVASKSPSDTIDARLAKGERVVSPTPTWPALDRRPALSLTDYRGRVVVLNFWASWCGPCRQEAALLERWQRSMGSRGGTVLGVDVLDVTSDARSFVRQFGITYPIVRDRDGSTLKSFQVLGYPETLVIDRRGRIAAARRFPVDQRFLDQTVLPLLREHV